MELGSVIGMISGWILIIAACFLMSDSPSDTVIFLSPLSFIIVVACSMSGTLIAYKFSTTMAAVKAIKIVFKPPSLNPVAAIDKIIVLANTARKEGVLALEESANNMDDKFLKKGVMLIVDGTDPELVKGIMETELSYIDERHVDIASVWEFLALQGPAWGMVGTVISLTLMLNSLNDPSTIGPKMAVAIITTLYGAVMANLIANPMANKLKQISKEEVLLKTVLIEGMLSIQAGENPRIIEEKLKSFLSPEIRDDVGAEKRTEAGE